MKLHIDYETFSKCDLKKSGAYRYAEHPSTEILMLSYALDDHTVQHWDATSGAPLPWDFVAMIQNPEITIHAFNAQFERAIMREKQPELFAAIHPHRWRCTMVEAYALSFSGKLDEVVAQIGLPYAKDARGQKLIHKFCKPQSEHRKVQRHTRYTAPEEWQAFCDYNVQDVVVEREVSRWITQRYNLPPREMEMFFLDQEINDRGLPVDMVLVERALGMYDIARDEAMLDLREITGLDNPNSPAKLKELLGRNGCTLPNMQAETVRRAMLEMEDKECPVYRVLELRQQLSMTSIQKWEALYAAAGFDDRLRGCFQFRGASRTGRYAGRIFQPQNLPRGTLKDPVHAAEWIRQGNADMLQSVTKQSLMNCLSSTIRCGITAGEGKTLVVCDLSAIESRVIGYVSGCPAINDTFVHNRDTYKDFAVKVYRKPYEEITKAERNFCKPPTLGCGFRLGAEGLQRYAESMGTVMTLEEAKHLVDVYRDAYPEVVKFWYSIEDAAYQAVTKGITTTGCGLIVSCTNDFLYIQLPSGRKLCYYQPSYVTKMMPWGKEKEVLEFWGRDTLTHKWCRQQAHGGVLTENIVQAIAYDVLCVCLLRANTIPEAEVVGHVHDEVILECNEQDADLVLSKLTHAMSTPPRWAQELLLDAHGFISRRYRKD